MKFYLILSSIVLYLVACGLYAFKDKDHNYPVYYGFMCLFFGVFSLFESGFLFLVWLANIPYLLVLLFEYIYKGGFSDYLQRVCMVLSFMSVLLGAGMFRIKQLLANTAGTMHHVKSYWGAWCWWGSFWVIFVAQFFKD